MLSLLRIGIHVHIRRNTHGFIASVLSYHPSDGALKTQSREALPAEVCRFERTLHWFELYCAIIRECTQRLSISMRTLQLEERKSGSLINSSNQRYGRA